jgi:hypothetical protein
MNFLAGRLQHKSAQKVPLYSDFMKEMFKTLTIGFLLLMGVQMNAQMDFAYQQLTFYIPSGALLNVLPEAASSNLSEISQDENAYSQRIMANWINYSAIVPLGGQNKITVSSKGFSIPPKSRILVKTSEASGAYGGHPGFATDEIELSAFPQDIIQGIGSSYTGTGAGNGHLVEYLWVKEEENDEIFPEITVIYTILPAD